MVDCIENSIFEEFRSIVCEFEANVESLGIAPYLSKLFTLLAENKELARCLIGKNGDAAFVERLRNCVKDTCFNNLYKNLKLKNSTVYNYYYHYVEMGCIGICSAWLNGDMKESPDEIADIAEKFIQSGVTLLEKC